MVRLLLAIRGTIAIVVWSLEPLVHEANNDPGEVIVIIFLEIVRGKSLGLRIQVFWWQGAKYRRTNIKRHLEGARTRRRVMEAKIVVQHVPNPGKIKLMFFEFC